MSDDSEATPAETPAAKPARKRTSARKAAKPKTKPAAAEEAPSEGAGPRESPPSPEPVKQEPRAAEQAVEEAPATIPFFNDSAPVEPPGNTKKRRRRKKKGGQSQGGPQAGAPAISSDAPEAAEPGQVPAVHPPSRTKLDSDEVAKKAWKMFQAEVGEEGLALIDDHDAREISRRCFRLAEIFLDEASRRNR